MKKQNNKVKTADSARMLRIASVVRALRVPLSAIAKKGMER